MFDRWITKDDQAIKQRILDYNEDDNRAAEGIVGWDQRVGPGVTFIIL